VAGAYAAAAARAPNRCAVRDETTSYTYAELDRRARQLEAGLRAHGLGPGDTIAILAHNSVRFVEMLVAVSRLGSDALLLSTFMSAPQISEVLQRERPGLIVLDPDLAPLIAETPAGIPFAFTMVPGSARDMATIDTIAAAAPPVGTRGGRPPRPHRRGKFIVLTSGTTGTPRSAHRPAPPGLTTPAAVLSRLPLGLKSTVLIAPPLFHTWGLGVLQLAPAVVSTVVLRREINPSILMGALVRERCTGLVVVPVMLEQLLATVPRAPDVVRSSLRMVASCGAPLSADVSTRFQDLYGDVLYNVYGSTEVSWATIATPKDLRALPGTAGACPRGTRLVLLDENDQPVLTGQVGRIFVANELLFEGYSGGQDALRRHGLLSTGDLGYFDPRGLLMVLGREDGMVISGAEKIYPLEVEQVVAAVPGVREVAVMGVEDPEYGQRLVAYVVSEDGVQLSPETIKNAVRARLARYAVPREVGFLSRLPRSATGKVVPRMLPPAPGTTSELPGR
jgi:fatty-acyl-CoA synthase